MTLSTGVKKFASEGFAVFAGRREGAKPEPPVKQIEAAGRRDSRAVVDARKEEEIISFLGDADSVALVIPRCLPLSRLECDQGMPT